MTSKVDTKKEPTEADKIWDEIQNKGIEMFSLPNQKVKDHCLPIEIEPSKLYLRIKSSAVLPSLEFACGPNFVVELMGKYVSVCRASVPITQLVK